MVKEKYRVNNLDCAHCSSRIEEMIQNHPAVDSAHLDFTRKVLTIRVAAENHGLIDVLNSLAGQIEPGVRFENIADQDLSSDSNIRHWIPIIGGLLLFTVSNILSIDAMAITILSITSYLMMGHSVILTAGRKLLRKQYFDENWLMTIATSGAIVLGEYTEAIAVMLLYEIGKYLEHRALRRSRESIEKSLSLRPDVAHVLKDNQIVDIPVGEVGVRELIVVNPGDRIPLDGIVRKGESAVDTAIITGESEPRLVDVGSLVNSGFINLNGRLEIEVTARDADGTVARIMRLIESAAHRKSRTEQFLTRFARWYTPSVVVAAALMAFLPTLFWGAELGVWVKRALVFLVVSCPCALVISIPLTYFAGIGYAAKQGIIFKGSNVLDNLRRVRTLVFDKTGTLTSGKLRIQHLRCFEPDALNEMLDALYLCEYSSSHPVAMAIKAYHQGTFDHQKIEAFEEVSGQGISMMYEGNFLAVGSREFMCSLDMLIDAVDTEETIIYVTKNFQYLGYVTFSDEIKSGMPQMLSKLRDLGVTTQVMLSGDRQSKAAKVARELALDSFEAELLPEDKINRYEEIAVRAPRIVAFAGDGLNDAPVIARSDISFAMGEIGNQASVESADIVLLNDRPDQFLKAFEISRMSYAILVQNVVLALGIKALVMAGGTIGISGLWEAVIADVGVTILAVLNAMRLTKL